MNDVDIINSIINCKLYKCTWIDCPLHFGQTYISIDGREYVVKNDQYMDGVKKKLEQAQIDILLSSRDIIDNDSFKKWSRSGGHPDKGGPLEIFQIISNLVDIRFSKNSKINDKKK